MSAQRIDGKATAAAVRAAVREEALAFAAQHGRAPRLEVVLVGDDAASEVYVRNKERAAAKAGIAGQVRRLPASSSQPEVAALLGQLSADQAVDGILLQLPVPAHLDPDALILAIDPSKDVDGLHPVNAGRLLSGRPGLRPCTPLGCLHLLTELPLALSGQRALVVGRSILVGKPIALLLLEAHCTVTIAHSRTEDLAARVAEADILIAAAGRAGLIQGAWIREGATVIDVGIHRRADGSLTGDVDFAGAQARAAHITPVPGGVGPMTIAMLLRNTVQAARALRG
ncbi:MAG: bifunctional methylenetetrahydrofolate dehydrogenase/methenyltetrahydrofolate cyclohydrolase FolD [Polyangiales bacterium]